MKKGKKKRFGTGLIDWLWIGVMIILYVSVMSTVAHALTNGQVAAIVQQIRDQGVYGRGDYAGHYSVYGISPLQRSHAEILILTHDKEATNVVKTKKGFDLK